ncbi:MAG: rod shape-determining protein MreC [Deltaproteobacteria bacterium]|nr:rod shape-determining protein MreC [Deltaproteobacteria bacterium]
MSYFRRFRDLALALIFLFLPFLVLKAHLAKPGEQSALDSGILNFSAPLQWVSTEAARAASDVIEDYVYLVDVKRENERLQLENERLRDEARALRLAGRENGRLRNLVGLRERLGGEAVSAEVIAKEISHFFRVTRIRIDRGERDFVRSGMPVVSTQGLVGQVRRTWGRYADVLLTVDRTSAIDVVVQRTGARGMLRGTGEDDRYVCRIQYLEREDEVRVGDEVYTSGMGQRFPASILVGYVTNVRQRDFGLYQEAEVTPSVRFSSLEQVLILGSGSRQQEAVGGAEDEEAP